MNYFRYKQFNKDVITVAVGYYLRYALSYRDISEILRERGVNVHHCGTISPILTATESVRKFGTIQLTGIYGSPADNFPLDLIFNRDIKITSGQAPVIHLMPKLYEMIRDEVFDPTEIITHTFPLEEADEAYKVF